jgi:hypothetical protein
MKLINKLKTWGAIGLISLASCAPSFKETNFEKQYGNLLMIEMKGPCVFMMYDKNRDGEKDLLLIYDMLGKEDEKFYLRLAEIWNDSNENGTFEESEKRKLLEKEYMPNIPYESGTDLPEQSL